MTRPAATHMNPPSFRLNPRPHQVDNTEVPLSAHAPDENVVYQPPVSSVALAFRRVHLAALLCAWIFGVALAVNTIVWASISFTDIRFDDPAPADLPAVVSTDQVRPKVVGVPGLHDRRPGVEPMPLPRPFSPWDARLNALVSLAASLGSLAGLLLAPVVALGLLLAVSCSIRRCERAAAALLNALLLSLAALPLSRLLPSVSFDGLLLSYHALAQQADDYARGDINSAVYFARHLMLPLVSLLLTALCAMRFRDGLEHGMYSREVAEYEDSLDREASNVSATSLRSPGRAAAALGRVSPEDGPPADALPPATKVAPGAAPRRLI